MSQLHKRFTDEQIKLLFQSYCQGQVGRADLQKMIGIGKSRFFNLLKEYRSNPNHFTIAYQRKTHARISPGAEKEIEKALLQEKAVVEDPDLPISPTSRVTLSNYAFRLRRYSKTERQYHLSVCAI